MKFLLPFLFFLVAPAYAWGYVPHEYPALYTHQVARIFLFVAFVFVLIAMIQNRLYAQKGWRYLFASLIFFTIWDLSVFISRIAEYIAMPKTLGSTEGWNYFTRRINIEQFEYLYYIGRLDFVLLNMAMLFFYLGLREHFRVEKKEISVSVVLPLLPILVIDITGNLAFILISILSLNTSYKLYKNERENAMWNYMVWLSFTWVVYSISRSFGHVLRHILIPTGNDDLWKILEPIAGSLNSLAIFLVGSVSLFFIWIYRSYLELSQEKGKLVVLVRERTDFIEQLERDKMELQELDKLKSAFIATVSHELRTPMNSIIGYTELLLDKLEGPLSEEQEKSLKKVHYNAKHLLRLIEDILNISKIETGQMKLDIKELDVNQIVESIVLTFEPLIKQKGLTVSFNLTEDLPHIYGDENKIRQVLITLLSNAVKFTHKGGITITTKPSEKDILIGVKPLFIEVCVEDTGIGIEEHNLKKIFDKFFQVEFTANRQYEGTGLGLSIAKGMVELHGGQLWATSVYGKGTKFCFTLPVKADIFAKNMSLRVKDAKPTM